MRSATTESGLKIPLNIFDTVQRFGSMNLVAAITRGALALAVLSAMLLIAARPAQAQTESVLYSFGTGSPDGAYPIAGLVRDKKGNLYGTTWSGGLGIGSVFELTATGTEKVLYSFGQSGDGGYPYAGLVLGKKGNLYGTTQAGGAYGGGTVFMVTPAGVETVLYSFTGGADGYQPIGGLVLDKLGNLYGTTQSGGANGGVGTVFKLTPTGTETVLYSFTGGADGAYPQGGLIFDKVGNLYGTTAQGGDPSCSCGTVFKVAPTGTETVLYSFPVGGADGGYPNGALVLGKKGYLYGTTSSYGSGNNGTVFKVSPTGKETTLYSFAGTPDGGQPDGSLVFDKKGNLYGTTQAGGVSGIGTVFELTPAGVETLLHSFTDNPDGSGPRYGGLVLDALGNLYGTTAFGGANGQGTVFKVAP